MPYHRNNGPKWSIQIGWMTSGTMVPKWFHLIVRMTTLMVILRMGWNLRACLCTYHRRGKLEPHGNMFSMGGVDFYFYAKSEKLTIFSNLIWQLRLHLIETCGQKRKCHSISAETSLHKWALKVLLWIRGGLHTGYNLMVVTLCLRVINFEDYVYLLINLV